MTPFPPRRGAPMAPAAPAAPPTATPDGVEYGAPSTQPGDQAPASRVVIDRTPDGKFTATCIRPGQRPEPPTPLNTFDDLTAYVAQEFGVQPSPAGNDSDAGGDAGGDASGADSDSDYQ